MQGYSIPVAVSVALHALLVFVLTSDWYTASTPPKKAVPNYVEARLVTLETQAPKQQKAKPQKVVDLTAQRREKERREAEARKQQQKKAAEQKAAREKAAKEKAAREKAAAEKARKERELKEKQAAEEARRRRADQLFDAVADEDEFMTEKRHAEASQSYTAAITQRIIMNWSRPPSARNGMQCTLSIQLVPTGRVIDVKVLQSSGNAAFDRAAEQAVKKAERFPELVGMDPQLFEKSFRQLNLVFRPEDLRQ
ncbi:cell envelope integrity protein TolA [Simiduia agarivorans]|uniref:TolA n=1 Tax=Simiduia agarivorans (strain DSM 21679 / JCM 13881 / BCRC 17597 / SA1) TaxID=1117647 RepID=H8YHZ4_SIMAS|nr:cell envelope integrity protein TolA [Simiduia agarivorans]AFD30844.1 TolA [Simiduia agarivorans SA1 = DSM 21679]AFV00951.1 protein TolA [Simiduia agarivorans SA1 = DSM 21679]